MPAKKPPSPAAIYQLKITLQGLRPPIWRRVLVADNTTLEKLHYIIQIAMGWTNSHLHDFTIHGKRYSVPHPDDWEPVLDERDYALQGVAPRARTKIVYQYDFGDSWNHDVVVEKTTLPVEPKTKYPLCVAGKYACPPEDVGGTWGYVEFLEALRNPEHEEHESYLEWIGGEFDPEAFDLDAVDRELRRLR
jgi:hypothetical protein